MPKIIYVEQNGTRHVVEVAIGWTVMEGAVRNLIPGIDADCGGACACATCQVYIDASWQAQMPPKSEMEEAMLDFAPDVKNSSRLSCQLRVTAEMDGLVVQMPASQH